MALTSAACIQVFKTMWGIPGPMNLHHNFDCKPRHLQSAVVDSVVLDVQTQFKTLIMQWVHSD